MQDIPTEKCRLQNGSIFLWKYQITSSLMICAASIKIVFFCKQSSRPHIEKSEMVQIILC